MFIEYKNFLDDSFCNEIIEKCSNLIEENKLTLGYNREGNSCSITDTHELKDLDKKIFEKINNFINSKLIYHFNISNSKVSDTGYSFHRYKKNDRLFTHTDGVYDPINQYCRILSLSINLTDNENADLIFPRHNKNIKSEKGKLVGFLPHQCYEHYMNNNSGKNRDVLVTWLIDKNFKCILNKDDNG